MLRRIPPVLSPELLKVLAEMGHGDKIVIGDANFAAASMAKNSILVRCDGVGGTEIMDAILQLMPLDDFVDTPVMIMDKERNADTLAGLLKDYREEAGGHRKDTDETDARDDIDPAG